MSQNMYLALIGAMMGVIMLFSGTNLASVNETRDRAIRIEAVALVRFDHTERQMQMLRDEIRDQGKEIRELKTTLDRAPWAVR